MFLKTYESTLNIKGHTCLLLPDCLNIWVSKTHIWCDKRMKNKTTTLSMKSTWIETNLLGSNNQKKQQDPSINRQYWYTTINKERENREKMIQFISVSKKISVLRWRGSSYIVMENQEHEKNFVLYSKEGWSANGKKMFLSISSIFVKSIKRETWRYMKFP